MLCKGLGYFLRKFFLRVTVVCAVIIYSAMGSFAQKRIEGLKTNPQYVIMLKNIDSLTVKLDSLVMEMEFHKGQSLLDSLSKDEHVSKVFQLENRLFDMRNKIGVLTSKCSVLEQDYIIKNLNNSGSTVGFVGDSVETGVASKTEAQLNRYLFNNRYLTDNLTLEELNIIRQQKDMDSLVLSLRDSIRNQYQILFNASQVLRQTQDAAIADSLYNKAELAQSKVEDYEKLLKREWNEIFDTKVYVYNRLLDKLNVPIDKIKELNNKLRDARSLQENADTTKFAPSFHTFPFKRKIILEYEKVLSEKLVYLTALDSIKSRLAQIDNFSSNEPAQQLPEWEYIHFNGIKVGGEGAHTSVNPVKKLEKIPTYGSVYMIRLLTLNNKLINVSGLRGVHSVTYFINENGKYEYYAGVYSDKAQAESEVEKLTKLGFVKPIVVTMRSGGRVADDGVVIPLHVNDFNYRVELSKTDALVDGKISEMAPGKELIRIGDKLYVGIFKSYIEAYKLAKAIGDDANIVTVDKN